VTKYRFVPMTASYAEDVAKWHYPGIYTFYDLDQDPEDYQEFMDPAGWPETYFAVLDDVDDLVGFFAFECAEGTLVLGLGLRPDLTGRGRGEAFVAAGLDFAAKRFAPRGFELSVASFNERAIRVYERLGFTRTRTFQQETNGGTHEFVEMRRGV